MLLRFVGFHVNIGEVGIELAAVLLVPSFPKGRNKNLLVVVLSAVQCPNQQLYIVRCRLECSHAWYRAQLVVIMWSHFA